MPEWRCIHGVPAGQHCPSCSAWPGVRGLALTRPDHETTTGTTQ